MGEERSLAHMLESLQQMGVDPSKFTMGQLEEVARVADEIKDPAKMKPEDFVRIAAILEQKKKTPPPKKKVGRNERCPCGSGKKYKKCCL